MALDAAVVFARLPPDPQRQAAALILVTRQATIAEIGRFDFGGGRLVGVVAGNTAEFARARLKTPACMHLLDLSQESVVVVRFRGLYKDGDEQVQGQSRPVIEQFPPAAQDT